VAFPGNSLYHATKWGIEGFCEAVAAEVARFGIGVTIVEDWYHSGGASELGPPAQAGEEYAEDGFD
jgi:NAD(P)-dependent dehydrogenase (short-subunit alcohol dehydrogenase family)